NAIVSSVPVSVESATGTVNVGLLNSSSDQGNGGIVNLSAAGNVTVGSILSGSIDGSGGDVTLSSSTGSVTAISNGTLTSSSGVSETASAGGIATGTTGSGQGGDITITAPGNIRTGWLLTGSLGSSGLQGGGNVSLTSTGGGIDTTINVSDIDAGLLVDLGLTSTQAALASQIGTELGMIITGSRDGNGGTVNLSAAGDIRTGAIVSGSQNGTGGTVTLTSSGGSIDTSNDAFFSGLTREAWLEGASAAGLASTDTIDFAQDLGFGTGVYTVDELATILDGFSFRLGIITGSEGGTGANVTLTAAGNVTTSNILTTSLDGNSGNISITSSSGAINGQEGVLLSGVNSNLLQSLGLGADLSTVLSYLSQPDVAFGGYITLSLNGNAGNITLNAAGDVLTNYLAASSFSGQPGNISVNSGGNIVIGRLLSNLANGIFPAEFSNLTDDRANQLADLVSRGVLNSSGSTSGGSIDIQATTSITTGAVNSSSTLGSGGSVLLDPSGDIEVYSINAQGGTQLGSSSSGVTGGNVTIATQSNFRALGSFTDQNGISASISTAAPGGGGRISISHGGNGTTPFTVGQALSSGSGGGNGVVGAITSGNFTIFPYNIDPTTAASLANGNPFLIAPESGYFFTERFPLDGFDNAIGSIGLFSVDRPVSPVPPVPTIPPEVVVDSCEELGVCGQPGGGISQDGQVLSIDEARDILALIEQRSGVKPALIYVSFEAPDFILQRQAAAVEFERDEARFSEQYEQHLNVPNRFQGSPLQIAPTDRDILQLLVVTSSEEPFLVSVPDATRERVLFNGGRMIDAIIDQEPEGVYLRSSQQLYSQLVAPIRAALEEREVENLVFIMDNSLRLLPVAALHDGEQYLIEKYSVGLMPSLSLTDTRFVDIKEVGLLAMGADTFSDEAPLPSVPTELSVISELWNAPEPLLNNRFTLENLRSARSNQRYGILHLATHGDFNPGAANQSYIRFGDRRVTLDQLRTLRLYDPTVELMVLSACRTAVGNPDAELGFAGLAHQAGVKTALGSLWYVGDQATLGLMTGFYDNLRTAPIKAEALRQAQLAMLRGEISLEDGAINIQSSDASGLQFPLRGEVIEVLQALPVDLRHPYAWSAFTMIGSPW
ncbi:MAG: CHAT domain-containing protein, partial [Prochlorotrichaceae cyanobacterium]